MQYALINGMRSEPVKGSTGICPTCNNRVIAKCGSIKVHHWAHHGINERDCDIWWENETDWHRNWKNRFPEEFREKSFKDLVTGENHRADIFINSGVTIEFQHSRISLEEIKSREAFYSNLIWVVDGSMYKKDFIKIQKWIFWPFAKRKELYYFNSFCDIIPPDWKSCSVPVFFDFSSQAKSQNDLAFFCLFPQKVGINSIIAKISINTFLSILLENKWAHWNSSINSLLE